MSLASQPTANVTVAISSSNSGEVSLSTNSLTFTPDDWDVAQAFTVSGVADGNVDGDQAVSVTLTVSSQDADYEAIASSDIVVTNQDTDTTPVIPAQIIRTNSVVRPHMIAASSEPTAILFVAHATGTMIVTPIGTVSFGETVRVMDGNVQQVSDYVGGVSQATVSASGMYAIIFEAQSRDRFYSIRSSAGTDAFTQTVTTNFLQPTDVNGDSETTPQDLLMVFEDLAESHANGEIASATAPFNLFADVSRDDQVTPLDALMVINYLAEQDFGDRLEASSESVPASAIDFLGSFGDPAGEESSSQPIDRIRQASASTKAATSIEFSTTSSPSSVDVDHLLSQYSATPEEEIEASVLDLLASNFV